MATRYAVANGNWSDVATWDGGASLPGIDDIVYFNNFTVTQDQNITVGALKNTASNPIVAGGSLVLAAGYSLIMTGDGIVAGAATIISSNINSPSTYNIITTKIQPTTVNSHTGVIRITGTATFNVTVTDSIFTSSSLAAVSIIRIDNNCTFTLTGNYNPWDSNGMILLNVTATGATINCNCIANNFRSSNNIGMICSSTASGYYTQSTINYVGTITGGNTSGYGSANGINSSAIVNITGSVTGGSHSSTCAGVLGNANNITTVIGIMQGNNNGSYAVNTLGTLKFSGQAINVNNKMCYSAANVQIDTSMSTSFLFQNTDGGSTVLYSEGLALGNPATTDVRDGVVYGASSELEGTLIVPPPASVAKNVPTDDTVGTMEMTPADFWAYANRTLTANPGLTATDITNILTSYGVSKLLANDIATALTTYGAAKTTDIPIIDLSVITDKTNLIPDHPASIESTGAQIAII